MRFRDVPQFTQQGNYQVTICWKYLESSLELMAGSAKGVIDMDPDYQRQHVWTEEQQSRYIEFVMRGGRSARDIYFNCPGWMDKFEGPFEIVDGKQRMEAARRFMRNDLRAFGFLLRDFEGPFPSMDYSFNCYVNNLPTREAVLTWYLEFNSAGTVHTQEELDRVRALLEAEKSRSEVTQ